MEPALRAILILGAWAAAALGAICLFNAIAYWAQERRARAGLLSRQLTLR